mmetsp:Transcript_107575/g.302873  ORF Transcript_107575/g.302873 Transcript_107575/m.302873 type:complete len:341 (+) Transcript_107575:153-1175(+)
MACSVAWSVSSCICSVSSRTKASKTTPIACRTRSMASRGGLVPWIRAVVASTTRHHRWKPATVIAAGLVHPLRLVSTTSTDDAFLATEVLPLADVFLLLSLVPIPQIQSVELLRQRTFLLSTQAGRWPPQICASLEQFALHVNHELLLRPQDAARSADPVPTNERPRRELEVLHREKPDERSSPSKPSLAMHGNSRRLVLHYVQELANDVDRWATAVPKVKVHMSDSVVNKPPSIVLLRVEADHEFDTRAAKDGHVVLGGECWKTICIGCCWARASTSKEPVGDNPIHVSIVNLLVVLVRLDVELVPIEPAQLDARLQAFQTVQNRQVERADTTRGITKR